MKKLRAHVKNLVAMELRLANDNFPLFHSDHEAFGVLAEEKDEATEEAVNIINAFDDFKYAVFHDDEEMKKGSIDSIEKYAVEAACEFIQVAAMAKKWKQGKEFSQEHADYLAKTCPEADIFFSYVTVEQLKTMLEEMHKEDEDAE